jgi:L-ascorbate metabolism protein UlaG (beta-lactamase superfamily)
MIDASVLHHLEGVCPMKRFLSALAVVLSLAAFTPAPAADAKKLVLRWHGQSFFSLETSKGTKVAFDPHAIEIFGRTMVKADLICISHNHSDHTHVEVIQGADKARILTGLYPPANKKKAGDWNPIDEKFKDIHVRTVGLGRSPTSSIYHDEMQGMIRGKNSIFVLEVDGLRIVHLGDLGHVLNKEQIEAIGRPDVLMIPVGGVYTLNGGEAKKVVEQLKPKMYVIPMHYGTKNYDELLPVDEFLEDQKKGTVEKRDTNELVIRTDFKPADPMIVVLHWAPK